MDLGVLRKPVLILALKIEQIDGVETVVSDSYERKIFKNIKVDVSPI